MSLDSVDTHYEPKVDFNNGPSPDSELSTEHILQPINEKAIHKSVESADWLIGVLLLIFVLLAWVRVYHFKRLGQLFQAFLYKLHVVKILRSNDSLITRISVALNSIYILAVSVFLTQMIEYHQLTLPYSNIVHPFLIILGVVSLVYPLKELFVRIVGWVFKDQEKLAEYTFNIFLLNKILGLALVPIVVLLAYLSFGKFILINLGIFLIVFSFLYRLYRGYFIGRAAATVSHVYIFLYLCTLESTT
ncbi:MAG: DUF4271 domain-containing protein [Flavobacteriales bacterium]|nr:DUF4271 domain-containing protein [Flavobacteriales bacterium]